MKAAVEWLVEELEMNILWTDKARKAVQQAKEMEKELIIEAYENGVKETNSRCEYQDAEQYYNETFKQETLTYTETAKKEERIFNSTMMSKQKTFKSE